MTCIQNAPSLPPGLPHHPPLPDYPFQLLVCDYFALHGQSYLIITDLFSGWITHFHVGRNAFDGSSLVWWFREYFQTFNVPEEITTDGGPQLTSEPVKEFLKCYHIHHRFSSAYFPHGNLHAELWVKAAKRLIWDSTDSKGTLNTENLYELSFNCRTSQHRIHVSPLLKLCLVSNLETLSQLCPTSTRLVRNGPYLPNSVRMLLLPG